MVFSSLTFLFLFLPAVLLVYFLVPKHVKNAVLFCFSLLFYAWGEPVYIGLMLFSTVLDYCCGRAVEAYRGTRKAKIALGVSIAVNLGLLCLFKYADFLLTTVNAMSDANPGSFTGMMIGVLATIIITIVLVQIIGCDEKEK